MELDRTNRQIITAVDWAVRRYAVRRVSVYNGGSFFELPLATIQALRDSVRGLQLDIESRPEFVTFESIRDIVQLFRPWRLYVRVGIDSFDESIRNQVLNKGISQHQIDRLVEVRRMCRREWGGRVLFYTYVLFGMQGVDEESVRRSVVELKRRFDGVIAIRYRRYLPRHPPPTPVSNELVEWLRQECVSIDFADSPMWNIRPGKIEIHL